MCKATLTITTDQHNLDNLCAAYGLHYLVDDPNHHCQRLYDFRDALYEHTKWMARDTSDNYFSGLRFQVNLTLAIESVINAHWGWYDQE